MPFHAKIGTTKYSFLFSFNYSMFPRNAIPILMIELTPAPRSSVSYFFSSICRSALSAKTFKSTCSSLVCLNSRQKPESQVLFSQSNILYDTSLLFFHPQNIHLSIPISYVKMISSSTQTEVLQMAKKNLIVGQSGGPTAVINSSLTGLSLRDLLILTKSDMFMVW